MRKAIVYASVHHRNTEKLVKRIAEECQFSLIDAVKQPNADLSSYDTFGPFKLVGGIAKGHPDDEDIKNAVEFVKGERK